MAGAPPPQQHVAAYQAVVLAGGEDQVLFPLTSNMVKALLPVANRPLISYPLKTLAHAGLRSAIVVGGRAVGFAGRCLRGQIKDQPPT